MKLIQNSAKAMAAAVVLGAAATSAHADLVIDLSGQYLGGWDNMQLAFASGEVVGTLTGISIDADFYGQVGTTFANDMSVVIGHGSSIPFPAGQGVLQVGGWSDAGTGQKLTWNTGASSSNQHITDTVSSFAPIVFSGDASDPNIYFGNGWNSVTAYAYWDGTLTLHGLSLVPGPGALALLGLAGVVGSRRRRH